MKTRKIFVFTFLAFICVTVFAATSAHADYHPNVERIKVQPSAIYQAILGQSLADTLAHVAQRSGIFFKIDTELGKDTVSQSVSANNWNEAVKSLLVNYNYTAIQENDNYRTVIVTGRKNAVSAFGTLESGGAKDIIVVEPKFGRLPAKYHEFPAGAVTAVNLPVSEMMKIKDQAVVGLDLPMGQFNVAHNYTVTEPDGSQTWVGYLANEGEGYRVFLSKGAAGIMGDISTPDGSYTIESDRNGVYLVDTSKLQHSGFEGDSMLPPVTLLNRIANAQTLQITQLQASVETADTALKTAQAIVSKYAALVNIYQTELNSVAADLLSADTSLTNAQNSLNNFSPVNNGQANISNTAALVAVSSAVAEARNNYTAFAFTYQTALNNFNAANNDLTVANTAAAAALANYNQAVNALAAAQTAASASTVPATAATTESGSTTTDTPVVDLMVVYTTDAQTRAHALQRISYLVTVSNQAYADSNFNMTLRLVHTEPTSYVENNSNGQALQDLSNNSGAFANISQTRAQYGADLVFLFRPLYANSAGSCGTTYVEFASGAPANAELAYGTISDGNAVDASGYFCAGNTFTHEIGHSLGLVHDREFTSFPGAFDYSYAWGVQNSFGTIMSYKTPVLMYFSTPTLPTQCAGQACGYPSSNATQSSDQTTSVNYTAPIVANFMPTTTTIPILN